MGYTEYADSLATKYGINPIEREYEGDRAICEAATESEVRILEQLWDMEYGSACRAALATVYGE